MQTKTIAHNQMTDAQPVPKQWPTRPTFLQLCMLSMTSYGTEYPFGQLGSAVPAVSPPMPCAPPARLLVEWGEKQKRP